MIYLKAIQGILGNSMPKRKGDTASRAKPNTGERSSCREGRAKSITVSAPQKKRVGPRDQSERGKKAVLERSSFCDGRVVMHPSEKPSEKPLGDGRTVTDAHSPPLEFLDDSDSHLESQKPGEREVVTEHTSLGSDWPNMDEFSTVTFSQEEPISLKLYFVFFNYILLKK